MSSLSPRRLAAIPVALALAATAGAGGAWASHQFTDVGDGTFFHDAIGNIVAGGCATGYSDGTFRPGVSPNRGQFAYWMSNCGGRVSYADERVQLAANASVPVADQPRVKIEAGAAGAGSGFVVVLTSWTATPADAELASQGASTGPDIQFLGTVPCPCNVQTGVVATFSSSPANPDFASSSDSWDEEDSGDLQRMSGSGMQVIRLAAGDDVELEMYGTYAATEIPARPILLDLHLTAMYVPFGWDGGPDLVPPAPAGPS
jgi:hypothetical protein